MGSDAAAARVSSARGSKQFLPGGACPETERAGLGGTPAPSHSRRGSRLRHVVPIATATPGWGLTAISQGLERREGAADYAALLIAEGLNDARGAGRIVCGGSRAGTT